MFNNINSMKVEGRASSLASMLRRELAAAHIQKVARGFITRLTRSIPLIKVSLIIKLGNIPEANAYILSWR